MELKRISVVGLGKLGLPLAACFAWKGFPTIGVDVDCHKIQAVNQGIATSYEPGLQDMMTTILGRLTATEDYENAVMNSDVTFILVPTPSDNKNNFLLQYVLETVGHIGDVLRKKSQYHLVVLTSTVMPGSMQKEVKPLLESRCGKRCGEDFGLCYNPEFVALGSVIHDLLNPDFLLIGESDGHSGSVLSDLYKCVCENNPPVARMNFVNAELTKLALNSYVTTKISIANTLARICECLPGADVNVVTSALGLDKRIGGKYLKGAIGYGGPCFPRDNLAMSALARSLGILASLAETTDAFNRQQLRWLAELVKSYLPHGEKVGILGLTYKPESDVVEESAGILLAGVLINGGIPVTVYDPKGMENARSVLSKSVIFAISAEECIQKTDVVVVTTPWDEFKQLQPKEFSRPNQARVVIDCWRILERIKQENNIIYVPLGVGILKNK